MTHVCSALIIWKNVFYVQVKTKKVNMNLAILMVLLVTISFFPVYATVWSTDSSSYHNGDVIILSGSANPIEEGQLISVQILNPSKSDFVQIDTFAPNSDGTFSRNYKAEGPKWNTDGIYTLKLFYNQESFQTTFEYNSNPSVNDSEQAPKSESVPVPKQESGPPKEEELSAIIVKQEPKSHIPGFPALDKSPQHYFDRYGDEGSYREWFDSEFPGKSIQDVVRYSTTHVSGFPDNSKTPQHYIDRYNNESDYQDWFNSEFPDKSIYKILGFPEPISIPSWIKNNALWWATGNINDGEFISGLQFMIENDIIRIANLPESDITTKEVPDWIRNNANWWAHDKISEKEFVNGIKYLISNGIIIVNK